MSVWSTHRVKHVDKDKDLAMALAQKRVVEDIPPELFSVQAEASDVKKRKYARLQIVRQFQNKVNRNVSTCHRCRNSKSLPQNPERKMISSSS